MSFEGYYQLLCKVGHYTQKDTYGYDDEDRECFCGEPIVWTNLVDQTNGCEATKGDPYDLTNTHEVYGDCLCGFVPLEKVVEECCDKCGSILDQRFKIPRKGGHKVQ